MKDADVCKGARWTKFSVPHKPGIALPFFQLSPIVARFKQLHDKNGHVDRMIGPVIYDFTRMFEPKLRVIDLASAQRVVPCSVNSLSDAVPDELLEATMEEVTRKLCPEYWQLRCETCLGTALADPWYIVKLGELQEKRERDQLLANRQGIRVSFPTQRIGDQLERPAKCTECYKGMDQRFRDPTTVRRPAEKRLNAGMRLRSATPSVAGFTPRPISDSESDLNDLSFENVKVKPPASRAKKSVKQLSKAPPERKDKIPSIFREFFPVDESENDDTDLPTMHPNFLNVRAESEEPLSQRAPKIAKRKTEKKVPNKPKKITEKPKKVSDQPKKPRKPRTSPQQEFLRGYDMAQLGWKRAVLEMQKLCICNVCKLTAPLALQQESVPVFHRDDLKERILCDDCCMYLHNDLPNLVEYGRSGSDRPKLLWNHIYN